ncbi:Lon protease family protein [Photobacterium alginatilyticum]|uniref:Lon protease family protein n=1 Tax=Photobacterium alginatilyticum TaxID=1775171 RepID=UPI004069653A
MKGISSKAIPRSKEAIPTQATKLTAAELFHPCDPDQFDFDTTDDINQSSPPLGLERAIDAIKLGVGVHSAGFNIFLMGSTGLGKHVIAQQLLLQHRDPDKPLFDWCYVNNFRDGNKPVALQLPAGMGKRLKSEIHALIEALKKTVPTLLQNEDYVQHADRLQNELNEREIAAFQSIEEKAKAQHCILKRSQNGYLIHPIKKDKVLSKEEFDKLPDEEKAIIDKSIEELRLLLVNLLKQVPHWDQEMKEKKNKLERDYMLITVDYLIGQLPEELLAIGSVSHYIENLKRHVLDNIPLFNGSLETEINEYTGQKLSFSPYTVYDVNIIVDNSDTDASPVIYEDNPTYANLIGRIEHKGELGTFVTNFTLIKPGAFHHANGGFLVIDVIQLLNKPFVWDVFKRTLLSKQIRLQPLEQLLSVNSIASLEPDSISLDVKIILIGDRMMYYMLKQYDPEFSQLFKVQADCSEEINRTKESCLHYSQLIGQLQSEAKARPLDRTAVARLIEFAARQAEDGEKLTLHRGNISAIILEADFLARQHEQAVITDNLIQQAIEAKQFRSGYLKECITDNIQRGINQIDTQGSKIGQVNGLSIISVDENMFGRPCRITAVVHLGQSNVVNIEREVDMSGPSHSKGVMILTAYLREQYEQRQPLSFSATLTFEQSYGMIDGDSASAAELCALLSAIAQIPLKQNIAVTGAIDQHGNIEAIGGVNEKIEGFYDICNLKGLTGEQGVIIPRTNLAHLMVNENVRHSVQNGDFHIWVADHVDQVMNLLTKVVMGKINTKNQYPANSINAAIITRIKQMNKALNNSGSSKPPKRG